LLAVFCPIKPPVTCEIESNDSALLDINYDQYLEQYLADMEIENDILLDLLSEQFYKYDRNLKNSRRVRKRNLKMERSRRSFDSIFLYIVFVRH
jgi:hypothetical protein